FTAPKMPVSGPKFKHLQLVDFRRVQIIHQDRAETQRATL
ncbi:MAG: hypothetical protein ACI8V5_003662, partial [Limisphaerales bacterium]